MISVRTPASFALLALHVALALALLLVPLVLGLATLRVDGELSLEAWRGALADLGRWGRLLANTSTAMAIALLISNALGGALAILVFKTDLLLRRTLGGLLVLLALVPFPVAQESIAALWTDGGARGSLLALGCVHGIAHAPILAILVGLALRAVPPAREELALLDAGRWRVLRRVTLPAALPAFLVASILILKWMLEDFSASDRLLVRSFAEEIYTQFLERGRPHEPTIAGLPSTLWIATGLFFARRALFDTDGAFSARGAPFLHALGRARGALSALALGLVGLTVALILGPLLGAFSRGKSIAHYARAFWPELSTTAWTSLASGAVAATLAIGIAWSLVRSRRLRPWLIASVLASLTVPAPLLALGARQTLEWLRADLVLDTPLVLVVVSVLRFAPLAILFVLPAVHSLDRDVEDAARMDGARPIDVWARVIVPGTWTSALAAGLLVAALSAGDLAATALVAPPGYETVAQRYFSLVHYGQDGDAGALALLSIALIALPAAGLALASRRRGERRR